MTEPNATLEKPPTVDQSPLEQATQDAIKGRNRTPNGVRAKLRKGKPLLPPIPQPDGKSHGLSHGVGVELSTDGHAPAREDEDPIEESRLDRWARMLPKRWMLVYVVSLATTGVPSFAEQKSGVHRGLVGHWKAKEPLFAEACIEAMEAANDLLEGALRVSAVVGDPEPIYQQGKLVGWRRRKDSKAADILLRAHRPDKFRPDYQGAPSAPSIILASPEQVADVVRSLAPVLKPVSGRVVEQAKPTE